MYLTGYKVIVVKFITLMICTILVMMTMTMKTAATARGSSSGISETTPAAEAARIQNLSSNHNASHKQSQSCWHNDKRRQFVNSFELQAFKEFLDYNHLKYGIIIYATEQANNCRDHQKHCQHHCGGQQQQQQHHRRWGLWPNSQQRLHYNAFAQNTFNKFLIRKLTEKYHLQFYDLSTNGMNSNRKISLIKENQFEYYFRNDFRNIFTKISPKMAVFLSLRHQQDMKLNLLKFLSENKNFTTIFSSFKWFIIAPDSKDFIMDIKKIFTHLNITIDADITVGIGPKGRSLSLKFYDLYKICSKTCSNAALHIYSMGTWTEGNGLQLSEQWRLGIAERRNNWENITIDVGITLPDIQTNNISSLEYINSALNIIHNGKERKTYQLIKLMENLFNCSFRIHYLHKEEKLLEMLTKETIEFSLSPMDATPQTQMLIDYSTAVHADKINFILLHPKRTNTRNIFLEPLTDDAWWTIVILIVITILLLAIHVHSEYRHYYWHINTPDGIYEQDQGGRGGYAQARIEKRFDFVLFSILEALFMQGPAAELFRTNSTRLLITAICIFTILILQFYGAYIVSSLLMDAPRNINNLMALYNGTYDDGSYSKTFRIGMEDIPYNYELFSSLNSSAAAVAFGQTHTSRSLQQQLLELIYTQRIWQQSDGGQRNIFPLFNGIQRVANGGFAFHVSIDKAYHLLRGLLNDVKYCELREIKSIAPLIMGIGIRKRSPYREFINAAILRFRLSSLLQFNDRKWLEDDIDCSLVEDEDIEVDLEQFSSALILMVAAIALSVVVLFLEILYMNWSKMKKKNNEVVAE